MPIGGKGFATGFETVGGGVADPAVVERVNTERDKTNWTVLTRLLNPVTGQVTSAKEFQAYWDNQRSVQEISRLATLRALADTAGSNDLYASYAA